MFGLIMAIVLPIEIMRPAAGITAITTMRALPNFCQNSKPNFSFSLFISFPPTFRCKRLHNLCNYYSIFLRFVKRFRKLFLNFFTNLKTPRKTGVT